MPEHLVFKAAIRKLTAARNTDRIRRAVFS